MEFSFYCVFAPSIPHSNTSTLPEVPPQRHKNQLCPLQAQVENTLNVIMTLPNDENMWCLFIMDPIWIAYLLVWIQMNDLIFLHQEILITEDSWGYLSGHWILKISDTWLKCTFVTSWNIDKGWLIGNCCFKIYIFLHFNFFLIKAIIPISHFPDAVFFVS